LVAKVARLIEAAPFIRSKSMKPAFVAPRAMLEKKAPHGKPCTHCGLCCVATICPVGQEIFRRESGPCPALSFKDGESHCALADQSPPKYRAAAALLIGAGDGCDARFNGEPPDVGFYTMLARNDYLRRDEIAAAKKLWSLQPTEKQNASNTSGGKDESETEARCA
jgi:hypothetical protein